MSANDKLGLSVTETAELLGVSRPMMYTLIHRADFPVLRVGRRVIIPRQGLEAWIAQQSGQAGDKSV